jgi:FK506-binding nuclear protein
MEPRKKYTQMVKKPFHISKACLDLTAATDERVQVMCGYDNRKYLLCTLQKDTCIQSSLDLNFDVGTEVSFITNGNAHVHLTGYLIQDEEPSDFGDDDADMDISLGDITTSNIISPGKRSKAPKSDNQPNGLSAKLEKRIAALSKDAPPAKKSKTMELLQDIEDDEDDEDDSDVDLDALLNDNSALDEEDDVFDEEADSDEGEEEEDGEEAEDEEVSDEEEEDGDDWEDESEEDEDDEVVDVIPPKQNGVAKKTKETKESPQQSAKKAKTETKPVEKKQQQKQQTPAKTPGKKTIEGGVIIEDLRQGQGAPAKQGKMVQVFYEGRFKTNNKVFDSATKGAGFKFRLGRGEVIRGWDAGVPGMKVGGKRRIICPPNMAYGAKGSPPTIPPNSTLVFEVELKNVQ